MIEKIKIAIFASGTGSNAKAIIEYSKKANFEVALIVSNKETAGVLNFSEEYDIDALIIDKDTFYHSDTILTFLLQKDIKLIVLAGFLWHIPDYLINSFENRIINIHPSLLPKFGGKGMYGLNVHQAVLNAHERQSGITIHLVNEEYDKGKILFQKNIDISTFKTAQEIAKNVLKLEHKHFPQIIEKFIDENIV